MKIVNVVLNEKTKVDLRELGQFELRTIMDAEDFTLNLNFNGKFALKMNIEQWESFVKGVMAEWSRRPNG